MNSFELIQAIKVKTGYSFIQSIEIYNHLLKTDYHLHPQRVLSKEEVLVVETFLRKNPNLPFEYIVGRKKFCGLELLVTRETLIPRVETEELVLKVISDYRDLKSNITILDLCTGSGAIALSLKNSFPDSIVYASDISEAAIKVAKTNAEINQQDIYFLSGDFLSPIMEKNIKLDLIVSNPPYISRGDPVDRSLIYEPSLALYSEDSGTFSYQMIFKNLRDVMRKNGRVYLEISSLHHKKMIEILDQLLPNNKYIFQKDMFGRLRFLTIFF